MERLGLSCVPDRPLDSGVERVAPRGHIPFIYDPTINRAADKRGGMPNRVSTRRQLLQAGVLGGTVVLSGCGGLAGDGTEIMDSDGDGVIDSEDYAPRDPDVQREEQVENGEPEATTDPAEPTDADSDEPNDTETEEQTETNTEEWWDEAWDERYDLEIIERSGADLDAYPVVTPAIDVPGSARDSIRVIDHSTQEPIDFGVRETDAGYELAFKVALDSNASREDVAVYYDNPDAENAAIRWETARNNVYDDFDDDDRGTNWHVENGGWDERGSSLYANGDRTDFRYDLETPLQVSDVPVYWETRVASRSTGGGADIRQANVGNAREDRLRVLFVRTYQNDDDSVGANISWDSPDSQKLLQANQFSVNDWIRQHAVLHPNGDTHAHAENEATGATGDLVYRNARPNGLDTIRTLQLFSNGGTPGGEWDYVKLRYSPDPEPRVEISS